MKILLLEDDYLYKESIKDFLGEIGYDIDDFEDGKKALEAIYDNRYDLLLLDIRVPSISGFDILKDIRENDLKVPVIFLTSLVDIDDLSRGYELGCSDYIKKPFELKELKYRVEQIIKQTLYHSIENVLTLKNGFTFDIESKTLYKHKNEVTLSAIEIKVIDTLIKHRGYFLSLSTLQELVWDGKNISFTDIRMTISRIRQKCGDEFIETKKMVGYRIA